MSQRALCYLVHDLPSSNNAFQNKRIWIHYRQREQITAVCLVFSSWSTSNLTHKFSKAYAIYWLKRLGQVSIRFLALELLLKCCSSMSYESKWGALVLLLNVPRSRFTVGTASVCLCGSLCVLYPYLYPLAVSMLLHQISSHTHTHTNPQLVERRLRSLQEAARCVPSDLSFCQ